MFKLDEIKEKIKNETKLDEKKWIVATGIKNDKLVFEKWIIFTDKTIEDNVSILYKKYISKSDIDTLLIDIVQDVNEIKSSDELTQIDFKTQWIFIWDEKYNEKWMFILPDTKWIETISQVIKIAKKKVSFSLSVIYFFSFSTKRIVF